MSEETTGIVSFALDPADAPQMSEQESAYLRALRDEDIDLSDVPDQGGRPWRLSGAMALETGGRTLVLDADVVAMFQANGDAGQERMNAVLREYAEAHRKTA